MKLSELHAAGVRPVWDGRALLVPLGPATAQRAARSGDTPGDVEHAFRQRGELLQRVSERPLLQGSQVGMVRFGRRR